MGLGAALGGGSGQSPGAMGGPAGPGPGAGLGGGSGQSPGAMGGPAGGMGGGPGGGGPGGPSGGMGGMGGLGFEMGGYTGAGRDMMVQPDRPAGVDARGRIRLQRPGGGADRRVEARQAAQGREGRQIQRPRPRYDAGAGLMGIGAGVGPGTPGTVRPSRSAGAVMGPPAAPVPAGRSPGTSSTASPGIEGGWYLPGHGHILLKPDRLIGTGAGCDRGFQDRSARGHQPGPGKLDRSFGNGSAGRGE